MLAAVLPHPPVTESSAKRLENGANAEPQLRGQKLDISSDQRQGHNLLSDNEEQMNFGPAVVSHLRAGGSSVSPLAGGGVKGNARRDARAESQASWEDDNAFLSPLNSPDRISLSGNARALANGLRATGAGPALNPPAAAPAASADKVEARPGSAGQRVYETVRWKGSELAAGTIVPPAVQSAPKTSPGNLQGTLPGIALNANTEKPFATDSAGFYKMTGNDSAGLVERVAEHTAALDASGNAFGKSEPARVKEQDPQSAVADVVSAAPVAAESGETGFGKSVRFFFRNLRSRLWGQAVAAYGQPPAEVARGRRLHIQV